MGKVLQERYMVKNTLLETIILLVASILSFLGMFGSILGCWVNGVLNGQNEQTIVDKDGQSGLWTYARWNPEGENDCWQCWKCEPCCGEPCNPVDGLRCAACWLLPCFALCTLSKFYATSQKQDCTLMGHVLPYVVAFLCSAFVPIPPFNTVPCMLLRVATRHNYRGQNGAGDPRFFFGDCLLATICAPCATCQELRSSPKESWDWLAQYQEKSVEKGTPTIRFFLEELDPSAVAATSGGGDKASPPDDPSDDE